jgi:hypothetical protein
MSIYNESGDHENLELNLDVDFLCKHKAVSV